MHTLRRCLAALSVTLAAVAIFATAASARTPAPRIVSLSPTATEDLFAVGAGKEVVAVDSASDYPANAPRTKLSGITPNIEAIAKYHPTLVVAQYDPGSLASGLRHLHIKLVLLPAASKVSDAWSQMRELGGLTGHAKAAKALTTKLQAKLRKIVASVPKSKRSLKVFVEISPDLYSASKYSYTGDVLRAFGLTNIADQADSSKSGYPQLSSEYVVAANPGLIVIADHDCCSTTATTIEKRPGWNTTDAVKHRRIVTIPDSVSSRWSPRIIAFAQGIANALNGIR